MLSYIPVSVSTLKQKVKVLVDKTDSIKEDTSGTATRVNNIDENMVQYNAGMKDLTNFVKVHLYIFLLFLTIYLYSYIYIYIFFF